MGLRPICVFQSKAQVTSMLLYHSYNIFFKIALPFLDILVQVYHKTGDSPMCYLLKCCKSYPLLRYHTLHTKKGIIKYVNAYSMV